jgi:hypothetical protein
MPAKTIPTRLVTIPLQSDEDEVWTPGDVASFLKLDNAKKIYELTRTRSKKPLPVHKVGKESRFSKNEVQAWFYGKTA